MLPSRRPGIRIQQQARVSPHRPHVEGRLVVIAKHARGEENSVVRSPARTRIHGLFLAEHLQAVLATYMSPVAPPRRRSARSGSQFYPAAAGSGTAG